MEVLDDVLWTRVRQGDENALAALFRRHADVLYNYCFRRIGDWGAAEEMVSIVFLEAWRRRAADVQDGSVLPWFCGVATDVVRNRGRSERRHAAALRRLPVDRPTPDLADDVLAQADDERQMKRLLVRLAELSQQEQDVIALCLWSDLSYEEAAESLGVPVGTVRSRLSRARGRLRELDSPSGHMHGTSRGRTEVSGR